MIVTPKTAAADAAWADEAFLGRVLDQANLNALRLALYLQTGHPELAAMRTEQRPLRGGAMFIPTLAHEHRARLKEIALAHLLKGPHPPAPAPSLNEITALLDLFGAPAKSSSAAKLAFEELAFQDTPRPVVWSTRQTPQTLAAYKVMIVGAGISGMAVGLKLKALGIPFEIIERQDGVGGTWRLNDYPEARVDISNFVYQFKFENHAWPGSFASQPEILAYLEAIARKYDLMDAIRTRTEVVAAAWDESALEWVVTLRGPDGAETISRTWFLLSASGLFSTPKIPDIPGAETFQGKMFHTTAWDHNYDFAGRRVALIGAGSSGAQLMPRLARDAAQLTVFQRTPNWVLPVEGYHAKVTPEQRFLLDNMPYYWNWFCYAAFLGDLQIEPIQTHDPDWQSAGGQVSERNDRLRDFLSGYLRRKIGHREDLVAKCLPQYPPAARRLVIDNGWYDALLRDSVELVTDAISEITQTGIKTVDGSMRDFDLIVMGLGFNTSAYLAPVRYQGRNGQTPGQLWAADGARAYLGSTMPGFPNFFMFYGPNGQARAGSFQGWADICARYVAQIIVSLVERGARRIEVCEAAYADYNARLDAAMTRMIWGEGGAGSYYLNEHGRSGVNMPWTVDEFYLWMMAPDLSNFEIDR
jgi:4-hydroxyacetophenone monooxygenase